jgi:hypothetical protein
MLPVAVMLAFELNVFFLKFALWVPPTNPLNTYRLLLWWARGRRGGGGAARARAACSVRGGVCVCVCIHPCALRGCTALVAFGARARRAGAAAATPWRGAELTLGGRNPFPPPPPPQPPRAGFCVPSLAPASTGSS